MLRIRILTVALLLAPTLALGAPSSSLLGDWSEPTGSIIRIEQCPTGICLRIVSLSSKAPSEFDLNNPDPTQRTRALCDLEIGKEFRLTDSSRASGGVLYDPKSGHTYRGQMMLDGDVLKLRGYIGTPIFGKTEVWQRSAAILAPCAAKRNH